MKSFSRILKPLFCVVFLVLAISCATDQNPVDAAKETPADTAKVVLPPADTLAQFDPDSIPDSTGAAQSSDISDSCMQRLIALMKELDSIQTIDEYVSKDFTGCRECFEGALSIDSRNAEANMGYSVSAVMALNADPKIHKMLDSLDKYFGEDTASAPKTLFSANYGLLAKAPLFAKRLAVDPTWPTFVTASYVQGIMDSSVVPVLSNVNSALRRFESSTNPVCRVVDQGDTVELDLGEAYVLHSMVLGLRAAFLMMTAYNVDLYKDASHLNYSWIDDLERSVSTDCRLIKVSGDTLYDLYNWSDTAADKIMFRMLRYNYGRSDFLTLRRANHALILSDLNSTALMLDAALEAVRGESNQTQDYDLIKVNDLFDLDSTMLETYTDMKTEGISEAFANHFKTPENLIAFLQTMLSGQYTFDETIDSVHIRLVIDLSAFFTHPVADLRTLTPYFRFVDEAVLVKNEENWKNIYQTNYASFSTGYCWEECVTSLVPHSKITDSSTGMSYSCTDNGCDSCPYMTYYLDSTVLWKAQIDSESYIDPIVFTTAAGADLDMNDSAFFPVLKDPTFGGLFPEMTQSSDWQDFFDLFNKEEEPAFPEPPSVAKASR